MELVDFPVTSSSIVEDIKELKKQMRHIKEQLARRDGNFESPRVADDSSCSFEDAVEDKIDDGIDNATFSLPSPQRHTIDESLGK